MRRFLLQRNRRELGGFLLAGVIGVILDMGGYLLLLHLGVALFPAKFFPFVIGSLVAFFINRLFSFRSRGNLAGELLRYILWYQLSAAANAFVNRWCLEAGMMFLVSYVIAAGVSSIMNFFGQKYFVFRERM